MRGFNVGATISLGDMELALDYINNEEHFMPDIENYKTYKKEADKESSEVAESREVKTNRANVVNDRSNILDGIPGMGYSSREEYHSNGRNNKDEPDEDDEEYYDNSEEYFTEDDEESTDYIEEPEEDDESVSASYDEDELDIDAGDYFDDYDEEEDTEEEEISEDTGEDIEETDEEEEIQEDRDKEVGTENNIELEMKTKILEMEMEINRLKANSSNISNENNKVRQKDKVVKQRSDAVKQIVKPDTNTKNNYDSLDIDALYIEVKEYMNRMGVGRSPMSRKQLDEEFGQGNVKRLLLKSYLITLGNRVTIGR